MYPNPELYQYLQKLQSRVEAQNNKIKNLEKNINNLQNEISAIKNNKPMNIEKIEYKFDQLKIERLEGTLNIGITPNGGKSIEEFSVNGSAIDKADRGIEEKYSYLIEQVKERIEDYLDHQAKAKIKDVEKKYNLYLDNTYEHLIIDDIKKQIGQRAELYLSQASQDLDTQEPEPIIEAIVNKVITDIDNAIDAFIRHLPGRGDDK